MSDHFRIPAQVHARGFDGETVVLDLAAGKYFALDDVGSVVWQELSSGRSVDEVVAILTSKYDVDEAVAKGDVERLAGELVIAGLLVRVP